MSVNIGGGAALLLILTGTLKMNHQRKYTLKAKEKSATLAIFLNNNDRQLLLSDSTRIRFEPHRQFSSAIA